MLLQEFFMNFFVSFFVFWIFLWLSISFVLVKNLVCKCCWDHFQISIIIKFFLERLGCEEFKEFDEFFCVIFWFLDFFGLFMSFVLFLVNLIIIYFLFEKALSVDPLRNLNIDKNIHHWFKCDVFTVNNDEGNLPSCVSFWLFFLFLSWLECNCLMTANFWRGIGSSTDMSIPYSLTFVTRTSNPPSSHESKKPKQQIKQNEYTKIKYILFETIPKYQMKENCLFFIFIWLKSLILINFFQHSQQHPKKKKVECNKFRCLFDLFFLEIFFLQMCKTFDWWFFMLSLSTEQVSSISFKSSNSCLASNINFSITNKIHKKNRCM